MPDIIQESLTLSLYHVQTASYTSLNIVNKRYPYWIISYVQQGYVMMHTGTQHWTVPAGHVMLHPPHYSFSEMAAGPGTHKWLGFDLRQNIELLRLHDLPPVMRLKTTDAYTGPFDALEATWEGPESPGRSLRAFALCVQILSLLMDQHTAVTNADNRFTPIIRHIEQHLSHKLSRDELAAMANLHPNYFDRAFRAVYGLSPMQFLREKRLQHARHLLETTDLTLNTVAARCGLGDAPYFSRVFRRHYGETPGSYRQRVKSTTKRYIPAL